MLKTIRHAPVLLLLVAGSAVAQEGIYIGLGLGNFDYKENFVDPLYGRVSDNTMYTKLFAGFEINRHFALEISYGSTDKIKADAVVDDPNFGIVTGTFRSDFTITALKALGQWPFDFAVVMAGLGYYTADNGVHDLQQAACCRVNSNYTVRNDGLTGMVGLERRWGRFGTRWGLRLEYEWWDIAEVDASNIGLGLSYGF